MRLLSGFTDSENAEAAGSSVEKQFQRQSGRRTKPKPSPQTSGEDAKKKSKDAKNEKRAAGVVVALGNFAKSLAAGLEKEGERRSKKGLSGAGFAAAFSSGIEGLTDYTDMLQGNAAPGEVLFDAAMKSAEEKNKKLEDMGVNSEDKAYEVDIVDEDDAPSVDPLGLTDLPKSGPEDKPAVESEAIKEKVEEGMLRGTTRGPSDPLSGLPYDVLAGSKSYRLPGANTQAAALRYGSQYSDQKAMPEARQLTGQGDTAYRAAQGLAGMPYKTGSYEAGGRPIQAN